jgi:hypothetical protein
MASDFHLFGSIKKLPDGKRFAAAANMKQAVISCLLMLVTDFLKAGLRITVPRWNT